MAAYSDPDLLQLSGLQHFAFCRRQWALIHLEQQWQENLRTVEGNLLHRRAHDEATRERRGDTLILRGLPIVSYTLGLSGHSTSPLGAFPFGVRKGCGSPFRWSTSGAGPRSTVPMSFSCAPRPCVWRRCCAVRFLRGRCSMESRDVVPQ